MIIQKIPFGKELHIGDYLAYSTTYAPNFGWFVGNGKTGSIQYISPRTVIYEFDNYNKRIEKSKTSNVDLSRKDNKGFTFEHIGKNFVKGSNFNKIIKITDPSAIFSEREFDEYEKAKKILTEMHFLKN